MLEENKSIRNELANLLMDFVRQTIKKGATNETEIAVLPLAAEVIEKLTADLE